MEIETLLKVLLSMTTAYFFSVSLIAPNPILKGPARVKIGGVLERTDASGQHMCMGLATLSILLCIVEVSSIITRKGAGSLVDLTVIRCFGAFLVVIGGSMRLWTYRALGKFFTFQIGVQKNQRLIKHGLYSIVRHPSYTAILFFHPGFLLWHLSPGSWARESGLLHTTVGMFLALGLTTLLVFTGYMICINRPPQEDKVMKGAFGKEWEEWAKDVPYRIVPGIY